MKHHHRLISFLTAAFLTAGVCSGLPAGLFRSAGAVPVLPDLTALSAALKPVDSTAFGELRYVPAERQFYRDGVPVGSSFGKYRIEDGNIVVAAGQGEGSGSAGLSADEASLLNGCEITEENGETVIRSPYQTARLIVRAEEEIELYGGTVTAEERSGLRVIQYGTEAEAYAACRKYQQNSAVVYAVPDRVRVLRDDCFFRDEAPSAQLNNVPEEDKSWGCYAIGADSYLEWLKTARSDLPTVTVAVVDTGIYAEHSWFRNRLHPEPADFTENGVTVCADGYGHGTHCAGIICQSTPENVRILPIKVLSDSGQGTDLACYCGMMYAVEKNADVISMSLGGEGDSPLMREAAEAAREKQIPIIAAAGNDYADSRYFTPAADPYTVTVSALKRVIEDYWEQPGSTVPMTYGNVLKNSEYSNYGEAVDFAAPGSKILSAGIGYPEAASTFSGTSMACPFVAAAYADLLSYQPDLAPDEIYQLLKDHAVKCTGSVDTVIPGDSFTLCRDDSGTLSDDELFGNGMICLKNIFTEKRIGSPVISADVSADDSGVFRSDSPVTVTLTGSSPDTELYYTLDGSAPEAGHGLRYQGAFTVSQSGMLRATAVDENGLSGEEITALICIGETEPEHPFIAEDGVLTAYLGVKQELDLAAAFPDGSLKAIGAGVFRGRQISKVILPASVTALGDYAFYRSSITELDAPGVTALGDYALAAAQLTAPNLGIISKAGTGAFMNCAQLTYAPAFADDFTVIPDYLFCGCRRLEQAELCWSDLTEIGTGAFCLTRLKGEYSFPKLEKLGKAAFQRSYISRLTLPETITVMPAYCLYYTDCRLEAPGLTVLEDYSVPAEDRLPYYDDDYDDYEDYDDYDDEDNDSDEPDEGFGFDIAKIRKGGAEVFSSTEFSGLTVFEDLEEAADSMFSWTSGSTVVCPKIRELNAAFSFTENLFYFPNLETVDLFRTYADKVRVGASLKTVLHGKSEDQEQFISYRVRNMSYCIGPADSPLKQTAEEYGGKYYVDDQISGIRDSYTLLNIVSDTPYEIYAEYVRDPDCSLKWYLQTADGETPYKAVKSFEDEDEPSCDIVRESIFSDSLPRDAVELRAELWWGSTLLDSRTAEIRFTDDPDAADQPEPPEEDDFDDDDDDDDGSYPYSFFPMSWEKNDSGLDRIVPNERYTFTQSYPQCIFYAENDCKVKLHSTNPDFWLQGFFSNLNKLTTGNASEVTAAEVGAGKNEFSIHKIKSRYSLREEDEVEIGFWLEIESESIEAAQVRGNHALYSGEEIRPSFCVSLGDKELTEGTDYTLTVPEKIKEPGRYVVTVSGIGKYYGECRGIFCIFPNPDEKPEILYEGKNSVEMKTPETGTVLLWTPEQTDYCIEKLSLQPGIVTISDQDGTQLFSLEGIGFLYGTFQAKQGTQYLVSVRNTYSEDTSPVELQIFPGKRLLDDCTVEIDQLVPLGEKPSYSLKYNGEALSEGVDYTVSVAGSTEHLGKSFISFRGIGEYSGETEAEYCIYPEDPDDDASLPDPAGPEQDRSFDEISYRVSDMELDKLYSIIVSDRMPGYLERYTLTVPENGTYELDLPDPFCSNACLLLYIDDLKPVLLEKNQIGLRKGQVCRFVFIHNFLPESEIIAGYMKMFFAVSIRKENTRISIDNIVYELKGDCATVIDLDEFTVGIMIPGELTDPLTGMKYTVTDVDFDSFGIKKYKCTFFTDDTTPFYSFCTVYGFSCVRMNGMLNDSPDGDLNGDGFVSSDDAVVLQRLITECRGMEAMPEFAVMKADLNHDSVIDMVDLRLLLHECEKLL